MKQKKRKRMVQPDLLVYSDGAYSRKYGSGAASAVVVTPDDEIIEQLVKHFGESTSQRMEITGALIGLDFAKSIGAGCIELVSDSKYVVNSIGMWLRGWSRRGWKKANGEPVKNNDLWRDVLDVTTGIDVHTRWVKGHNGNTFNELADQLASENPIPDPEYVAPITKPGIFERKLKCSDCGAVEMIKKMQLSRAGRIRCIICGGPMNKPSQA